MHFLLLMLMVTTDTNALEIIGGSATTIHGGTAVLSCKLIDTTESLTQISWQRLTRGKPQKDNFLTISSKGPHFFNGRDDRFKFVGNFTEKDGSLQLSNVTLIDEGTYTCIFTLFPSGTYETEIPLNVLVPPVITLKDCRPALGNNEVPLVNCTAAGSKPPVDLRWLTGTLEEKVRASTNSRLHANGTTTIFSSLFGVPTRELNNHSVQCVINSPALEREETRTFTIHIHSLEIIGGSATTIHGGTAVLSCKLIDTTESLTQISWQRLTRGKPQKDNFLTISSKGPHFFNGRDDRFKFVGNFTEKDGSLQLSNVTLIDEGTYTCIFTLFPSGTYETEIPLNVLVPPVITLKDCRPALGNNEVPLVNCTAAGSKPPVDLRWLTGTLEEKVRASTNSRLHANGTTTIFSSLFGVPTRELNNHSVQCVINSPALEREETRTFTIHIHSPPLEVNITERSENSFECQTEAYPSASFTWTRSGQSWPQSGVRVDSTTLQFLTKSSELNGLYQCEASNVYGSQRGYLHVYFTSGSCSVAWTLFSILFTLNVAAVLYYFYKHPKTASSIPCYEGRRRGEMHAVRTTSNSPEVAEEEHEETPAEAPL